MGYFFMVHLRIVPPCVKSKDGVLNKARILKKIIFEQKKNKVNKCKFKVAVILEHPLVVGSNGGYKEIKGSLIFSILVVKETENQNIFNLTQVEEADGEKDKSKSLIINSLNSFINGSIQERL